MTLLSVAGFLFLGGCLGFIIWKSVTTEIMLRKRWKIEEGLRRELQKIIDEGA